MIEVFPTNILQPWQALEALKFCGSASALEASKVGWIPFQAYREAHETGRVLVCYNNDELVGFCLWGQKLDEIKVYQIWIRPDARLILHGRALIHALAATPRGEKAYRIRLWCAEDLAANLFWKEMGFTKKGWRHGPKKTSTRRHLLWFRKTREINLESGLLATASLQASLAWRLVELP